MRVFGPRALSAECFVGFFIVLVERVAVGVYEGDSIFEFCGVGVRGMGDGVGVGMRMDVPQDCWAACMVDGREEGEIGVVEGGCEYYHGVIWLKEGIEMISWDGTVKWSR